MKRRLLALLAVGIVLISMAWLASNPSPQRRPPSTNGPLLLAVTRQIRTANELTVVQREGLTRKLAMTSSTGVPSVEFGGGGIHAVEADFFSCISRAFRLVSRPDDTAFSEKPMNLG